MVNGRISNEIIINQEIQTKRLEIRPKLKGGSLSIIFQNVHGMPTNRQLRHKTKLFSEHVKEDIKVLQETACVEKDRPWTGIDD